MFCRCNISVFIPLLFITMNVKRVSATPYISSIQWVVFACFFQTADLIQTYTSLLLTEYIVNNIMTLLSALHPTTNCCLHYGRPNNSTPQESVGLRFHRMWNKIYMNLMLINFIAINVTVINVTVILPNTHVVSAGENNVLFNIRSFILILVGVWKYENFSLLFLNFILKHI